MLPVVVVGIAAVHILDPREAGFGPAVFLQGLEEGSSLSVGRRCLVAGALTHSSQSLAGHLGVQAGSFSQDQPAQIALAPSEQLPGLSLVQASPPSRDPGDRATNTFTAEVMRSSMVAGNLQGPLGSREQTQKPGGEVSASGWVCASCSTQKCNFVHCRVGGLGILLGTTGHLLWLRPQRARWIFPLSLLLGNLTARACYRLLINLMVAWGLPLSQNSLTG